MTFTPKGDFTFAKYEYCRYRVKPFIRNQFLPLFFFILVFYCAIHVLGKPRLPPPPRIRGHGGADHWIIPHPPSHPQN